MDPRDRILDWAPNFDERSRAYPIRAILDEHTPPFRRIWHGGPVLDQGAEGACVGFGWTGELLARPNTQVGVTTVEANAFARQTYKQAQLLDEWAGEDYEGTSVLAGAKVVQRAGMMSGYRWCFSVADVRDAVIEHGPVVIGVNWYYDMYWTDEDHYVHVGGSLVGGHCLVVLGFDPEREDPITGMPTPTFRWRNSWGKSYGDEGNAWIRQDDLARLLDEDGEACVPEGRGPVDVTP
jgi:C1A family cysteine protease